MTRVGDEMTIEQYVIITVIGTALVVSIISGVILCLAGIDAPAWLSGLISALTMMLLILALRVPSKENTQYQKDPSE